MWGLGRVEEVQASGQGESMPPLPKPCLDFLRWLALFKVFSAFFFNFFAYHHKGTVRNRLTKYASSHLVI